MSARFAASPQMLDRRIARLRATGFHNALDPLRDICRQLLLRDAGSRVDLFHVRQLDQYLVALVAEAILEIGDQVLSDCERCNRLFEGGANRLSNGVAHGYRSQIASGRMGMARGIGIEPEVADVLNVTGEVV